MISQEKIASLLPQQYPFLMIDKIIEFKKDESLTALKNITGNEWNFEGRSYPSDIFPETLIIEAAAQAAIAFYQLNQSHQAAATTSPFVLGKIKSEFFESVKIGDQLLLQTKAYRMLATSGFVDVDVHRQDTKIAEVKSFYSLMQRIKE